MYHFEMRYDQKEVNNIWISLKYIDELSEYINNFSYNCIPFD